MTDNVLRIVDLGKMYRIGVGRGNHPTLRDTIVRGIRRPIERLRHPGSSSPQVRSAVGTPAPGPGGQTG